MWTDEDGDKGYAPADFEVALMVGVFSKFGVALMVEVLGLV